MSLNDTPQGNRLHIGIFGKRNSGKSTLMNTLLQQNLSTVSPVAGTTTDPVHKAIEMHGLGPVVFYDTAGFDDVGKLGELRVQKTQEVILHCDMAILVCRTVDVQEEKQFFKQLQAHKIPTLCIWNGPQEAVPKGLPFLIADVSDSDTLEKVRQALIRLLPEDFTEESIVSHLVSKEDVVLLVIPQDIQAPKGRLILPQVQTIRDLLDHQCILQMCTKDLFLSTLQVLKNPPRLIIVDSQIFPYVYEHKPAESQLTSFSVLFARYKGDMDYFVQSASQIDALKENSHVLIAEACSHAPLEEDIGRVKIPAMLRKKYGPNLKITMVSGTDFPEDLSPYDLIIHCGGCMFNKKYVLSRVEQAKKQKVPMTNYGIAIAYVKKILEHVVY